MESLGAEKAAADPAPSALPHSADGRLAHDGAAVLSTRYYPADVPTLRTANLDAVVQPAELYKEPRYGS